MSLLALFDERSPRGGRAKAWLFLTHPGPSLLVTAVVVAAAGLLARRVPALHMASALVGAVLLAQLATGVLNDWADVDTDLLSKPYKPIARGVVRRGGARAVAIAGLVLSIASATTLGWAVVAVDVLGIAAGVGYDLALKRNALSWLAWWAGFMAVPLMAMAATNRFTGAAALVPLTGMLALSLQIANGLPDIDGDRAAGRRTLPVVLGSPRARLLQASALLAAAACVAALRDVLGQGPVVLVVAAGLVLCAGAVYAVPERVVARLGFPLLACATALAAVTWLAAFPV